MSAWRSAKEPPPDDRLVMIALPDIWRPGKNRTAVGSWSYVTGHGYCWCIGEDRFPLGPETQPYAWRELPRAPRPERFR